MLTTHLRYSLAKATYGCEAVLGLMKHPPSVLKFELLMCNQN